VKLPRDLGGEELACALAQLGYQITRQTGSHLRLTTTAREEHHVTIPKHKPLKVGTLNRVLNEVAQPLGMDKQELLERLFP
jgi:predicted RNA binding protein YcfA (HicA-like mRNA interferase family)